MSEATDDPYWNIYIPAPSKDKGESGWYQSYIRAGAPDTATETVYNPETNPNGLVNYKDGDSTKAGLLMTTAGRLTQRSQSIVQSSYSTDVYTAVFSGTKGETGENVLSSAAYSYSVGSLANQLAVSNQAKFSFNSGINDTVNFGDKSDFNLINVIAAVGGIKYEPIAGYSMKIAPWEIGFGGGDSVEFKGYLKPSETALEGKLRGVKAVKLTCAPTDKILLTFNKTYAKGANYANVSFVALAGLWSATMWAQGSFADRDSTDEEIKSKLKALNTQMQLLMALFKVLEAAGLILAGIIYTYRIGDKVLDPAMVALGASEIQLAPGKITLKAGTSSITIDSFGIEHLEMAIDDKALEHAESVYLTTFDTDAI